MDAITKFDNEEYFNEELKKQLDDIVFQCKNRHIPFFYSACVANDENGSKYVSDVVSPGGRSVTLKDDRISKHLAVATGFDVVPSRDEIEIEIADDVLEIPEDF